MVEDLKLDDLTVYINMFGNTATKISNHVRTKLDKPTGDIKHDIAKMFNCSVKKIELGSTYELTFYNKRDITYFMLFT